MWDDDDDNVRPPVKKSLDMNAVVENLLPTPAASRSGRNRSASDGAAIRWSLDSMHHLLADTTQPSDDGNNTTEPPRTLWPADDSPPVSSSG